MIKAGDILIVDHELINESAEIVLAENEKVVVRELMIIEAHWSRLCPDIWISEELLGIMLENHYGIFKPRVFKEFNKSLLEYEKK
jgi:hypothetical protein